jgi:hypothetical protein
MWAMFRYVWIALLLIGVWSPGVLAQEDRKPPAPKPLKIALGVYVTAQAMDLATTERVLAQGGYEKNPMMRYTMDDPALAAVVKVGTTAFTTWAVMKLAQPRKDGRRRTKLATGLAIGLAAGMTAVAVHNYRQVRRE